MSDLDIEDGALHATIDDGTFPCGNAVALADGGFLLPYHCRLHSTMRGALVVTAA